MVEVSPFNLDDLRRRPDVEAPELVAVDAADRLLLATVADRRDTAGGIATINDSYGALTLGSAGLTGGTGIRAFQDGIVNERALALNAADQGMDGAYRSCPLDATLLDGVSTVLLRLPRSLDELDEIAWTIAAYGQPDVQVLAGGRLKHMSLSMNAVLGRYFDDVTAGLARQKSRVLVAAGVRPVDGPTFPRSARYDVGLGRPLELRAYGATFGGAALDPGTHLLLPHLRGLASPESGEAIDLGCGNGAISAYLALAHPHLRVHATDQSASAIASTAATAAANGVADRIRVSRDDALSALPDASAGAIVLNPPFHIGSTVHAGIAHRLFDACARVLAPGGELWTVWNSHLRYRPVLERTIGPTVQLARSPRFTVTRSTRR
ncbi:class I SAM-dependent methyltransferase [Arthrobacter burdickii]|uniref:Methyltransferase n=1 Tax=Arthrobacter burdickii TaxID=3035920 RepID=A0ABT8K2Z6_9MICC|nr:methyltransferase [Arthrobacter burdickii]MDN4611734.1 methyltransferase [Arthrobacter burdickii]